jgi:hypothetical protein
MYRVLPLVYYEQAAAALSGDVKFLASQFPPTPIDHLYRPRSIDAQALVEMLSTQWTEATLPATFCEVLDVLFKATTADLRTIMKRWIKTNPCPSIIAYLIRNNPPIDKCTISNAFLAACDLQAKDIALALMPSAQAHCHLGGFYAVCCSDLKQTEVKSRDWKFARTLLERISITNTAAVTIHTKTLKYCINSATLQEIIAKALKLQPGEEKDQFLSFVHKYLEIPQSVWYDTANLFLFSWRRIELNYDAIRYAIEHGANWRGNRPRQHYDVQLCYPSHKKICVALYKHGMPLKLLLERVPGTQRFQRYLVHQQACLRKRLKRCGAHSNVFVICLLMNVICGYCV